MKMKTTWDLGLLYKSPKDPQIEKDLMRIEQSCNDFAKKWNKDSVYTNKSSIKKAVMEYEELSKVADGVKPFAYFHLARDIDTDNPTYTALLNQITERMTKAHNTTLFFELKLGTINKSLQQDILRDSKFKEYHYFLKQIFDMARYRLSEPEEKIMALKSLPSHQLWVDATEKAIGKLFVHWKGKKVPIHEASGILPTLPRKDRAKLHDLIAEQYKSISEFSEAELNAIVHDKKINDELRGLKHPYSATVLDYQNTEEEILPLLNAVRKHYTLCHRLYTLKARMMNLSHLASYDLSVNLEGKKKKYSFEKGVEITRKAFAKADPDYVRILDQFIVRGQIDVYPRLGKKGGGYCWAGYGRPTYILLNWADTFDSVTTLAHEMGHAIHGEYSNRQRVLYAGHPISTAEVASTLLENFVFDELVAELPEKEKIFAKFNKIQDSFSVISRQIAWFSAEEDIHKIVREKGQITARQLTDIRKKHVQAQIGPVLKQGDNDGWAWVAHSHIRNFFYVYSYAYGELISTVMYANYKKDPKFITKINEFLSAGESASPANIFKSIGIDTTKSDFWEMGLKSIEQDLKELEKMVNKQFPKK